MVSERGFTLIELLLVIVIVGLLVTMSAAGYRHARMQGAEASAIAALDAINQAQFGFMMTCGGQRYAPTLPSLGTAPPGGTPFLSPDMTMGEQLVKSGYGLQMKGEPVDDLDARPTCTGVVPAAGYQATADPLSPGITGLRFFGTNADRVIYEDGETFTGNMPERGAPGHGREIVTELRR